MVLRHILGLLRRPLKESQMGKTIQNDMETGFMSGLGFAGTRDGFRGVTP